MLLFLLIIIPFISSILCFLCYGIKKSFSRWIALIGMMLTLCISGYIWYQGKYNFFQKEYFFHKSNQLVLSWIPRFGIEFHIALDGFSLLMVLLTSFLGIIAILSSWNEIKKNIDFFYFNLMLIVTGVIGIFISFDLFLFFIFWEIILIPIYFLIIIWGNNSENIINKTIAANKFIIYMQFSSLMMLASILGLVITHYNTTHILTFNYDLLAHTQMSITLEYILMLGFFFAFAVKMPIFPFHGWLADFIVCTPTCGAIDIVSILLKTAPYALLRYNFVLFPHATKNFTLIAMCLGLFSIFYGSLLAFSQNNIKRLIAYSTISHMGLILIAIYSNHHIAFQGLVIQILSNSISTAALCILSGQLYKITKTQDISNMGGLWKNIYWIPGFTLFFALANLGIPSTGNFIGEFLILLGVFYIHPIISGLATLGIIFSAIYSLNMMQNIYFGSSTMYEKIFLVNKREISIIMVLIFSLIFLGIYPQKILEMTHFSIYDIQKKFNNSISTIRL